MTDQRSKDAEPAVRAAAMPPQRRVGEPRRTVHCIQSSELFAGASEVHIEHDGALYRLQRTSLGKLILTK